MPAGSGESHDGAVRKRKARPRRRYGTGTVFRRGDRWAAQVTVRRADGRRRQITRIRSTEDAARDALSDLLEQLAREHDPADRQTVGAYLIDWLEHTAPSVRASTLTSYRGHVELHIDPLLGGIFLDRLRPSDVARLVRDRLDAGLSPTTVVRILTTLSMALDAAVRDGRLRRNVAKLVRRPKIEREPIAATSPSVARRILAAVSVDPNGALYVLLLGSGLRSGEACGLDWRDVDLEAATVRVRTGKTARSKRIVPIPAFAVTALRAHQAKSGRIDGPVFVGERSGERLRPDVAYHRFLELLDGAGLPRMRVHDLRHAAATLLLAQGMDMRYLADQLGHADQSLTARVYAHVIPELQRAGVSKLDEALG